MRVTTTVTILPVLLLGMLACLPCGQAGAGEPVAAESPRITALSDAVKRGEAGAEQAFWDEIARTGTPLIEPGDRPESMRMTFVLRVSPDALGSNARIFTLRTDSPFVSLQRVAGTNTWSRTWQVSRTARGMYLLAWPQGPEPDPQAVWVLPARDGTFYELFTDPLSRLKYPGELAPQFPDRIVSAFEGGAAPEETYLAASRGVRNGRIVREKIQSAAFGTARELSVYLPAAYHRQCRYSWVLMYDAEQFISLMSVARLLDNMIAQKVIPPVVAVLMHSGKTRLLDLPPSSRSQAFLRDEVIPWVRANFAVSERAQDVAIAGFSHGGLAAMNAGLLNSDVIGNVIAQSGSFWWAPDLGAIDPAGPVPVDANSLSAAFASAPRLPLRIYLEVGTWEGNWQVASSRHLRDVLSARDYPMTYSEYEGPHDYISWRATFPNALVATLGAGAGREACAAGR